MEGALIILSSPSGAGKTTLVKKLSSLYNFEVSVSYTTRIPRINEINDGGALLVRPDHHICARFFTESENAFEALERVLLKILVNIN